MSNVKTYSKLMTTLEDAVERLATEGPPCTEAIVISLLSKLQLEFVPDLLRPIFAAAKQKQKIKKIAR